MKLAHRIALAAAPLLAVAGIALGTGTAHAAPLTTTTVTTHVINRPDGGNGGTWAFDDMDRTLTVTVASDQTGAPSGSTVYVAKVTDSGGSFSTILGALAPNQSTAGVKVSHTVDGTFSGSITYRVTAPSADLLVDPGATALEDDMLATPAASNLTGAWPVKAFANAADVVVTENSDWSWTYKTGCETWVDSAANGDGNLATDGNVTGKLCPTAPAPSVPSVSAGHVITVNNNRATVGWSDSATGWPSANHCVEVREFGYGFTVNGSPHIGFTCDHGDPTKDVGYLSGLAAGHTYFLQVVPATGTYGSHHQIPGTDSNGGIDVFTTR